MASSAVCSGFPLVRGGPIEAPSFVMTAAAVVFFLIIDTHIFTNILLKIPFEYLLYQYLKY